MKKLILSLIFLFSACLYIAAQKPDLMVKSGEKGLYLEHKVSPKESFFSIGRLYNVHPRHIAAFNKLDLNKGLQIEQRLRIPLTDTNFTQKGNKGTPVYYKPASAASLSTVSKENNNVSVSSIKAWNGLSGDQAKKDSKLIIGFLLSKEMPSVTIKPKPAAQTEEKAPVAETKPDPKPEPKQEETQPEKIVEAVPPVEKPQEIKEVKPVAIPVMQNEGTHAGQGFFKAYFEQQVRKSPVSKDETVTAGIFKTTSGWQDEKYYVLIDGVPSGTIIKITNPASNKTIFAKVLGEMNGIRQNEGYTIRISNAAAAVLLVGDTEKFILRINY